MKVKDRDKNELERRLQAIDSQFVQQDRLIKAATLGGIIFGAAVLAVVGYLV